jgi:hypothetical protein
LDSLDGEIGKVKEFYFDDRHWAIRYLVADTGNWLTGRQVLVSPYALDGVMKEEQKIAVDLTKKQIEDSPSLDCDKPVSRVTVHGVKRILLEELLSVVEEGVRKYPATEKEQGAH